MDVNIRDTLVDTLSFFEIDHACIVILKIFQ
jgi:hypothetical protein